jgi:hypothetical protein
VRGLAKGGKALPMIGGVLLFVSPTPADADDRYFSRQSHRFAIRIYQVNISVPVET